MPDQTAQVPPAAELASVAPPQKRGRLRSGMIGVTVLVLLGLAAAS